MINNVGQIERNEFLPMPYVFLFSQGLGHCASEYGGIRPPLLRFVQFVLGASCPLFSTTK